MERRLLIAILLTFVVLYGFQALFVKPKPDNSPTAPVTVPQSASTSTAPTTKSTDVPAAAPAAQTAAAPLVGDNVEREIRVETSDVIAVFTNRGARMKSWRLKHYFDQNGQPQELVDPIPNQPLPFTLRTPSDDVDAAINNALYAVSGDPTGPVTSNVDLKFEYRDSAGLAVTKSFQLEPTKYVLTYRGSVTKDSKPLRSAIQWGPAVAMRRRPTALRRSRRDSLPTPRASSGWRRRTSRSSRLTTAISSTRGWTTTTS